MALPQNTIGATLMQAPFLSPDILDTGNSQSLESGGVAISDPSQGRLVQTWRAYITGGGTGISVEPFIAATPTTVLVSGATGITSVSLAFDSNMAATICYMESGTLKLRWFNSLTSAIQTDSYTGATSGRVSADDKRQSQEGASDVIFAYTLSGTLYWRQQRDRYLTAYTAGTSGALKLRRIGMHNALRFQFELTNLI